MATQAEGKGQGKGDGGVEAGGELRHPQHTDDPWFQPESGVPRREDYEHPPLSEDD